ncbi:hypothetical protein [Nostoc sp.]|uniref:hypothetical protein n=1 Tax=Nostoc sp. TaxID=1180 RepID=UPI002FF76424
MEPQIGRVEHGYIGVYLSILWEAATRLHLRLELTNRILLRRSKLRAASRREGRIDAKRLPAG